MKILLLTSRLFASSDDFLTKYGAEGPLMGECL